MQPNASIFVTDNDTTTIDLPNGGKAVVRTAIELGEFIDVFVNTPDLEKITKEGIITILTKTVISLTDANGVTYENPDEKLFTRLKPYVGMALFKRVSEEFEGQVKQDPFENSSVSQ